jgi:hypothetical protein
MANATAIRLRLRGQDVRAALPVALMSAILGRAYSALRRGWCTLNGGHYRVLHAEPNRLALRCVGCGHTTPGWEVSSERLAPRYHGDPERLRLAPRAHS